MKDAAQNVAEDLLVTCHRTWRAMRLYVFFNTGIWPPRSRGTAGGRVLVFVVGAFAEMSEDVSRICDIIAHDLARTHVYRQRHGSPQIPLDLARDIIIHGPAHCGANGAVMPLRQGTRHG